MFIFIVLLFASFAHANSSEYHTLEQNIASISADPRSVLTALGEQLEVEIDLLSAQECNQLIEQLTALKKTLCDRPKGGLLVVPLLATMYFGGKAFIAYCDSKWIAESKSFIICAIDGGASKEKFLKNLLYFLICATATFWIEAEYCATVGDLFHKERMLEQKIDQLIAKLKERSVELA